MMCICQYLSRINALLSYIIKIFNEKQKFFVIVNLDNIIIYTNKNCYIDSA